MNEEFISEPITPVPGTFKTASMIRGEPALPGRFVWRDQEYAIIDVLEAWKESGPCSSGGGEQYLRKHWYRFRTDYGLSMTVYFERQPRSKNQKQARWWLYTVEQSEGIGA